jgi:hypothetical protein
MNHLFETNLIEFINVLPWQRDIVWRNNKAYHINDMVFYDFSQYQVTYIEDFFPGKLVGLYSDVSGFSCLKSYQIRISLNPYTVDIFKCEDDYYYSSIKNQKSDDPNKVPFNNIGIYKVDSFDGLKLYLDIIKKDLGSLTNKI